jgi:hypothetical protein
MLWLGDRIGYLPDAVTQLWVRATGTPFDPADFPWLNGPIGDTRRIGRDFYERLALRGGGSVYAGSGLLPDVAPLVRNGRTLDSAVADFYQNTAAYGIDAWSQWDGALKPFGVLLAHVFSRRLEQLNVPLDNLDTSRGMSSEILEVRDASGSVSSVAWIRTLIASGRTIYCGNYSTCRVPGFDGVCLKVSFPLPNGNATVILWPEIEDDGSLVLTSSGEGFGDPGFYFVLKTGGHTYARYVRAMRERIRVYRAGDDVRTDHQLWFFGRQFLQLHYRLSRITH